MVNIVGSTDNFDRWKPKDKLDWLTLSELARLVSRDTSRIRQLEREGVIAAPIRVKVGRLRVRLYSPAEARKIEQHFRENAKPGQASPRYRKSHKLKGGRFAKP